MGNTLCKDQADIRPGIIPGCSLDKINVIGFFLNSDSRALTLYCQISDLDYNYVEVNMLKGEHTKEEFKKAHPSMHLPIVQDGAQSVYGSTLIQMMHIYNRHQASKGANADRLHMEANLPQLNSLFAAFDQRVRPVTKRIRSMLLVKRFKLKPEPTQEQIDRDLNEFNCRILPMLDH